MRGIGTMWGRITALAVVGGVWAGMAASAAAASLQDLSVSADRARPEVCLTLDRAPLARPGTDLETYIQVADDEGAPVAVSVAVRDRALCVLGLEHNGRYRITLRPGLPLAEGDPLIEPVNATAYVPDRTPSLAFRQTGTVLAPDLGAGLPLTSVNVARAELRLLRIGDRALVDQLRERTIGRPLDDWDRARLADTAGSPVWQGTAALTGAPNVERTTLLPLSEMAGTLAPGAYVLLAREATPGTPPVAWEPWATQWFVVSDLGLTAWRGDDGITVQVRSIARADPLAAVTVTLIARNNRVLGTAETTDNGVARFAAGLGRGRGGDAPALVTATVDGADDFTFLDLTATPIDLADRGAAGAPPLGDPTAVVWTERGVYRPGETVHMAALLRDRTLAAVPDQPLVLTLRRPDGQVFLSRTVAPDLGGYTLDVALPTSVPGGQWTLLATLGRDTAPIGRTTLQVAEFVPPTLEVRADVTAARVPVGTSIPLAIQADTLYGTPGAGLAGDVATVLDLAEDPGFGPALRGYRFGRTTAEPAPHRSPIVALTTDDTGAAAVTIGTADLPNALRSVDAPLIADLTVSVLDPAGRPVTERVTVPVDTRDRYIGIRPPGSDGVVQPGRTAAIPIALVAADGTGLGGESLDWRLVHETVEYVWYREGRSWQAEPVVYDTPVTGGTVTPDDQGLATVQADIPRWGRYRIALADPNSGVQADLRFHAGAWGAGDTAERPDQVIVRPDRVRYRPGETARVFIRPPYDAEVTIALADTGIRQLWTRRIAAAGETVEVPLPGEGPSGLHLLVNAHATAAQLDRPLPRRAIGLAWLAPEPAVHRLDVQLDAPALVRPDQPLPVTLQIAAVGDVGETTTGSDAPVRAIVMVVDDGVLQLTDHAAPDPLATLLARRALGVAQRDLYGRLIDPSADAIARLTTGGDGTPGRTPPPPARQEILAWSSGIVAADADGHVTLQVPLPDFAGRARIMAVAWSDTRLGAAEAVTTVRPPMVARLALPRLMAPGDRARAQILLDAVETPGGPYALSLDIDGPLQTDTRRVHRLIAAGTREARPVTLTATGVGEARLTLRAVAPDGTTVEAVRRLTVRPAVSAEGRRLLATVPPGGSLSLDTATLAGLQPASVDGALTLSSSPMAALPAVLQKLQAYPWRCTEQSAARMMALVDALPLIDRIGDLDAVAAGAEIQDTTFDLMARQDAVGAFGLWSRHSPGERWLSAFVAETLLRAHDAGMTVPESGLDALLSWLGGELRWLAEAPEADAARAYALYVLARAGRGDLPELRYLYEQRWSALPTDLARAQVAAALMHLGDGARGRTGFARLLEHGATPPRPTEWIGDYGSALRDRAAVAALALESGAVPPTRALPLLDGLVTEATAELDRLSTQELVWLVRAATALGAPSPVAATLGGAAIGGEAPVVSRALTGAGALPITVANTGAAPLYAALDLVGLPEVAPPATAQTLRVRRWFHTLDGTPLDLDAVSRGDRFVLVLQADLPGTQHRQIVLEHPLPAGWEVETLHLTSATPAPQFAWLDGVIQPDRAEFLADRYTAFLTAGPRRETVRVAAVVRAVTPGTFTLPGAFVQDMYRPQDLARQAAGRITVHP